MVAEIVQGVLLLATAEPPPGGDPLAVVVLGITLFAAVTAGLLLVREFRAQRAELKAELKEVRETLATETRGLQQALTYEKHLQRVIRELQAELGWGDSVLKTRQLRGGIHAQPTRRWPTGSFEIREPEVRALTVQTAEQVDALTPTVPIPRLPHDQVPTRDLRKRRREPSSDG